MKTSLGLLEVAGLALAVKAADTMVKAANVALTGIERTNGSGWMLITITGDVAAVQAAITDGATLARRENGWVADRVIARPADGLDRWRDGAANSATKTRQSDDALPAVDGGKDGGGGPDSSTTTVTGEPAAVIEPSIAPAAALARGPETMPDHPASMPGNCNLCYDPDCPRRKGDPRATCIHDGERG